MAQDRTKWRGLIKRGAGEYEAKRISEAEQKRAQRRARAKAPPTELSSSDLSCSTCNRQSRVHSATGSLVSSAILEHTNNNTSHSRLGLVIVSNDRRARTRPFASSLYSLTPPLASFFTGLSPTTPAFSLLNWLARR